MGLWRPDVCSLWSFEIVYLRPFTFVSSSRGNGMLLTACCYVVRERMQPLVTKERLTKCSGIWEKIEAHSNGKDELSKYICGILWIFEVWQLNNLHQIVTTKGRKSFLGSGGIRTHASEETGALNQRLRPLGHATFVVKDVKIWIFILLFSMAVWSEQRRAAQHREAEAVFLCADIRLHGAKLMLYITFVSL